MEDIEETLDDEELDDEAAEPGELGGESGTPGTPAAAAEGEEVESIQDLLVKQEAREGEEETEESVLSLSQDDLRDESLAVKVVPPQSNEFTCSNCYLVKHRSQLKDKARMLCRDCA